VDGARTPFIRAKGRGPFLASDLAVFAARALLLRLHILPTQIDEVITGSVMPSAYEANISRVVGLRLGLDESTPAWTVQRNCASGMQAVVSAMESIQRGQSHVVLAGGCEAMSQAPLLYSPAMVDWLLCLQQQKNILGKLKTAVALRPAFFKPIVALLLGLKDHQVNLGMGQTAEILAHDFNISRHRMDAFSVQSHHRLAAAQKEHRLNEIVPMYDNQGHCYDYDDGVRRDSSVEKLAKLSPVFDVRYGRVTPGNSSQITDGAAYLLLASETAVKQYDWPILGEIVDYSWAALDPSRMGLGPAYAIPPLLTRNHLALNDIDYWEINEAFAVQVLACIEALASNEYCQRKLGLPKALGTLPMDRLNVDGGAIACGHPVGASGARIILHLLHVLQQHKAKLGVASLCVGGGQGGAVLLSTNGM
jgi:acetyl-CoA C-acetyltransferase